MNKNDTIPSLFSKEFRRDPYSVYRHLRSESPIHRTLGMTVLSRYDDVLTVLQEETFSSTQIPRQVETLAKRYDCKGIERAKRFLDKSLVFTDDPDHQRLRRLVNKVLRKGSVFQLRDTILQVVDRLLTDAWADGEFDAISEFATVLPTEVICEWMNLSSELRGPIAQWTHEVRYLLEPGLMTAKDFDLVRSTLDSFIGLIEGVVAERRTTPGDDLISRLALVQIGEEALTQEEVIFLCIMCFVAGTETTRSLLGNGILALLDNPDQYERVRGNPNLIPSAVEEMLRYESPLQLVTRIATDNNNSLNTPIHAGEHVLLCLGSANRDPDRFVRPDCFDVGRQDNSHLAFGSGMHGCLGSNLAKLQANVTLEWLCDKRERLQRTTDSPPDWQENSFLLRGLETLPVRVVNQA